MEPFNAGVKNKMACNPWIEDHVKNALNENDPQGVGYSPYIKSRGQEQVLLSIWTQRALLLAFFRILSYHSFLKKAI